MSSRRLKLTLQRYGRSVLILILLMVAGTASGLYILVYQRLNLPIVGHSTFSVKGAFPTVAAVAPGMGEPVQIAGVDVGQVGDVGVTGGQGILNMELQADKIPGGVLYRDAHAALVPRTPLKDMQVDLFPGHRAAGILSHGGIIRVGEATSPTDSDELLNALDVDTRTWLTTLVADLGRATQGRGSDIRKLFGALGPTTEQLREIGDLLAQRRQELAAITHNLGTVTEAVSARDAQLGTVARAGDATLRALADQDVALRTAVERLPGTLSTARTTLNHVAGLADVLGPTATALIPTARHLPRTLRQTETLFRGAALLPLDQIPPFIRAVQPLVGQLPALGRNLSQAVPPLISSFKVIGAVTNELAFVPGGGNRGFLYWLAWFSHNADSFLSTQDANGNGWRLLLTLSCSDVTSAGQFGTLLKGLLGANLSTLAGC